MTTINIKPTAALELSRTFQDFKFAENADRDYDHKHTEQCRHAFYCEAAKLGELSSLAERVALWASESYKALSVLVEAGNKELEVEI